MNEAIRIMMNRYTLTSLNDYENALKEIIQEIALLGLWRSKFFEKAAFYGGSALRILYGLDRFSEDLDFSLLETDIHFSINKYCKAVTDELSSFGFHVTVQSKTKNTVTNIDSAFVKTNTLNNLITIDIPESFTDRLHSGKLLKIKLEIDTDPPGHFKTEAKYIFQPIPFSINTFTLPHLFAGKMHAILCRTWQNRVKGRDWYDLVWYVGKGVTISLKHLESRMRQTGHLKEKETLTEPALKQLLYKQISNTDFSQAVNDIQPFIKDSSRLEIWSKDFFNAVCEKMLIEDK